jgi:hypothetical protein
MRKLILAATTIAAVAVPAIAPVMASAAPSTNQTYSVGTHSPGHADTTGIDCPACTQTANGPVWAYDNLNLKYVVTPSGTPGQWTVAVTAQGSFAGFADPTTGLAQTNSGSVNGTITYYVTSPNTPKMALVPSQEPSGTSIRLPISQMFGLGQDPNALPAGNTIAGGPYSFSYNKIDGQVYHQ